MKSYNEMIPTTKEERITGSPLDLRLGSSCGDGECFLFSVDRLNGKLLFGIALKTQSGGDSIFNTLSI